MYKGSKILAIIPARGGSKGIPGKNIIDVNGKPLIQYTIDAAKGSRYIDKVVVSTDSTEIAEVAKSCGAEVPFLRPDFLASDSAKTIDALVHCVKKLQDCGEKYDYIVLLQPTQPLRTSLHIDEAIMEIINSGVTSLVSISLVKEHPILMRTLNAEKATLSNLLKTPSTVRRQDFPNYYKVNGAIYINSIKHFNNTISLNDNKHAYIMDQKYDLDIDDYNDLELLRIILKSKSPHQ
ncbi:acylneuraminate cytidylyltransferase family protein [Halalkalibacter okhensis]|uniref:Acylneuraminate cytidylyltransferase n=1 Tax=Halalkalibacter okhensis TaxID=333138 RepID=A0A0B0IBP3_9BACI|nr:acylneuraminate cytidylyltransferase family protein [Halalkalibacter okhensis]KHF38715.1 acylneuraminate cytidylyltransferase [Halalkalibacter okhensis]